MIFMGVAFVSIGLHSLIISWLKVDTSVSPATLIMGRYFWGGGEEWLSFLALGLME
jgi:hypothetical protein